MKVISPELTASTSSSMGMNMMTKNDMDFQLDNISTTSSDNSSTNNQQQEFVNVIDFIRGDPRLPDRHVFDRDAFPDYSRATQRRLVAYIQEACERQNSPVSVHQWANEEHDDRTVRRIRFRCAFFRKKKRRQGAPCCLFQFQVCYQEQYGWCLLNGKGQHRHNGHPLAASKTAANNYAAKSSFRSIPATRTNNHLLKPATTKSAKMPATKYSYNSHADSRKQAKPVPVPSSPVPSACMSCTPIVCGSSGGHSDINARREQFKTDEVGSSSGAVAAAAVAVPQPLQAPVLKETSWDSKTDPAFMDFALDSALDDADWDMLNEVIGLPDETEEVVPPAAAAAASMEAPCAVPSAMADGLLQKTIHLGETPFPEVTDLDDKCEGILVALRSYAQSHGFAVTVEDNFTADRPGERTMRVVLHCLGGCNCCYQVALLWVVGLTKWQIYCQPDGIFVHGCGRLEEKNSAVESSAMSSPLNQALDHLADFLNGEVVCPDDEENRQCGNNASCCMKPEEEKEVSENVRQETRKAVVKVAGVDATASAA